MAYFVDRAPDESVVTVIGRRAVGTLWRLGVWFLQQWQRREARANSIRHSTCCQDARPHSIVFLSHALQLILEVRIGTRGFFVKAMVEDIDRGIHAKRAGLCINGAKRGHKSIDTRLEPILLVRRIVFERFCDIVWDW